MREDYQVPSIVLLYSTPDALKVIEHCGRTAYGSPDGETDTATERWIAARVRGWELDVLEHASTTWEIQCSRVAAQQLTRHRIAAYTMQSQRFRETPLLDVQFVPPECKDEDVDEWLADMETAYAVYEKWRAKGYHKQAARYHLPLGSQTKLVATWNFRELLHIFHMRRANMAEPEVQAIADLMWRIASSRWPVVFKEDIQA